MFIKKIRIKNFKSFANGVELDLSPNFNGIKKDLEKGFFQKRNNSYISIINSIGGTNSSGKTSILDAINLFFEIFRIDWVKAVIKDNIENKKFNSLNDFIKFNENIKEFNNKFLSNNNIDEMIIEMKKNMHYKLSNNFDKEIKICILFGNFEDEKDAQIDLIINPNEEEIFNFYYKNEKLNKDKISKFKDKFKNEIYIENNLNEYTGKDNERHLNEILSKMIKKIGSSALDNFLKTLDPNFHNISWGNESYQKILHIVNVDNSKVNLSDFSLGTKKAIFLLDILMRLFETSKDTGSGFILFDEIEVNLHNNILNLFKKIFQIKAKKLDLQLFFTSHNPNALSKSISYKQIFLIERNMFDDKTIKKASLLKPNNSFIKKFIEEKISSHPDHYFVNEFLSEFFKND